MEQNFFKLSKKKLKFLFIYFTILNIIGIALSILTICYESFLKSFSYTIISIIGGIGTALLGSSIFYLRKLYKSAIKSIFNEPQNNIEFKNESGLFFYYLLRPLFAIAFSILIHLGIKASVSIIAIKEASIDSGLIYLTMFLSFFAGFAAGDMITKLETISKEVVTKSIDKYI